MIVVTGGAGFIGSNLVAELAPRREVVVCDRFGTDDRWRNLAKHPIADWIPPEGLFEFLGAHAGAVEIVVHMGAISSTTEPDVDRILTNNFVLSRDLWRWCAASGCRFLYASSAATYGSGNEGFRDDETQAALGRLRPSNAYGWSKHLFDQHVARTLAANAPRPPQWAGLKFFNVYGPNEYHKGSMKSVVAQIWPRVAEGQPVRLFRSHRPDVADGDQRRDFVWIGDCVRVVDWLLTRSDVNGIFNVGSGRDRSFLDLARAVHGAAEREERIEYIDMPVEIRDRYQYFTRSEVAKLRDAGFREAFTSLEDGVRQYVQGYLASDDPYR